MKAFFVLRQDVVELACGDVDAQFAKLFEQQRLGDVAVVVLVQDVGEQGRTEVAGQGVVGQRRQQGLAVGGHDAFAAIAGNLAVKYQFLDKEVLVAVGGRAGRRVGEGNLDLDGGAEGGDLGAFG